jgi:mannose-1-phosphate guanylyltransferase
MPAAVKALLLAAGIGARLRPLTNVLPKCLMPINGRPLLSYWLQILFDAGVDDIIVNLHHHANIVRQFVERGPHAQKIKLAFEEELLGTAGTLLHHKAYFNAGPVLVAHADNLSQFSFEKFKLAHDSRPSSAALTMMTFVTHAPEQCGVVELNRAGIVVRFHEKVRNPPTNLANAAVYIVEPEVTAFLETLGKKVIDFSTEVLPHFIGRIYTYHNDIYHRDIGTLASLLQAQIDYPFRAATNGLNPTEQAWNGLLSGANQHLAQEFTRLIRLLVEDLAKERP